MDSDAATGVSPVLREVFTDVMSNLLCNIQFLGQIQSTHICTSGSGGVGACGGDSGSPVVTGNMQASETNLIISSYDFWENIFFIYVCLVADWYRFVWFGAGMRIGLAYSAY